MPLFRPRQIDRVGRVLPVGLQVDEAEDALGAGHGYEGLVVLVSYYGERMEEEAGEEEKLDDLAGLHVALEDAPAAEEEQGGDEELAVELEHRLEDGGAAGEVGVVLRVVGEEGAEEACVQVFAHKPLGHADAVDRLDEGGSDRAPPAPG